MKDKQPTEEQVKRLWEWCGLVIKRQIIHSTQIGPEFEGTDFERNYTYNKDGRLVSAGVLPVNLNNLFEYAIPRLQKEWHNWKPVLHDWIEGLTSNYDRATLALFWILLGDKD